MAGIGFNKVILIGNLTADPELRQTPSGISVCRFNIAINRRGTKPTGDQSQQTADFINCVAFGRAGEFAERYFRKGMKVAISGRIQTGSYTNKDGVKVYTTEVVIEEQEFAECKQNGESERPAPSTNSGDGFMNIPDGIDEELPFN